MLARTGGSPCISAVARTFCRPPVGEIAVRAHEHRSEVSEQPIIRAGREVNALDPRRVRGGFFIRHGLEPDPAAILEKAVESFPRTVRQHEIHVRKTLPAHPAPMLPAWIRQEERLGIGDPEARALSRELVVDLAHTKDILERTP